MPRTMKEYQQRQEAGATQSMTAPWGEEEFGVMACVIYQSARSTPMGDGCTGFADFGDAICFFRYQSIPEELATKDTEDAEDADEMSADLARELPGLAMMEASWKRYRSRFTNEEIRRRRDVGERALDELLERFVREGYRPEMKQTLIEIVNAALIDFELHEVFVLPGDLEALLDQFGNPLADYEAYDDEQAAEAAAPKFDLNNPVHRQALAEHLAEVGL